MRSAKDVRPRVSVVVPTCGRPELLKQSLSSALNQTYQNIEIIVSDDEWPAGESWRMVHAIAERDPRVRLIRNEGPRGQVSNMNTLLRAARGEWIKPLYDDDVLSPECIEKLVDAASAQEGVAIAACLAQHVCEGKAIRIEARKHRARVERLHADESRLAMYLQDLEIGIPTQVMVHRSCIVRGAMMEHRNNFKSGVDVLWYIRALAHGDLLLVNEALVDRHQGAHKTVTSEMSDEELYREFASIREMLLPMIDPALQPPELPVVQEMLGLIRSARELCLGRWASAIRRAVSVHDPRAWGLFLRWVMRRAFPGRFEVVPRLIVSA